MKLLLVIIVTLLSPTSYVYALNDVSQQTEGPCSPAVNDTKGNVTITCEGVPRKDIDGLMNLLTKTLGKNTQLTDTNSILSNVINDYLKENQGLKLDKMRLTNVVSDQARKINNILDDEFITDGIKDLILAGKIKEAETLVDSHAVKLDKKDKELAAAHYERGRVKELRIKYTQAKKSFAKAAILQPENTTYLSAYASILDDLAEYSKAIEYYELALFSGLKTYGEEHPKVAVYRNNLGNVYKALGDYPKAIEYYEPALVSGLKTYGEEHPKIAIRRNNLGSVYKALGDYPKAIEYYELALVSDLKTYGEEHPQVAVYRNNLGNVYQALGDYPKAIEYLELAYETILTVFGDNHPSTKTVKNNLDTAMSANK